jgi:hypothetical protein
MSMSPANPDGPSHLNSGANVVAEMFKNQAYILMMDNSEKAASSALAAIKFAESDRAQS